MPIKVFNYFKGLKSVELCPLQKGHCGWIGRTQTSCQSYSFRTMRSSLKMGMVRKSINEPMMHEFSYPFIYRIFMNHEDYWKLFKEYACGKKCNIKQMSWPLEYVCIIIEKKYWFRIRKLESVSNYHLFSYESVHLFHKHLMC